MISSEESLNAIMALPPLAPAREQISLSRELNALSIEELHRACPVWIREDMLLGINRLWQVACGGKPYLYPLWPEAADPGRKRVSVAHFPAAGKAPFVLICAGGAYTSVASIVEAFPIAARLNEMGFHAFTLEYRTGEEGPAPMEDLAMAIRFILSNAGTLNVEPEGYGVCGMSAGGHLASTLGAAGMAEVYGDLPKPAAVFLGYPVVTMGRFAHGLSKTTLLGRTPSAQKVRKYSVEEQITPEYPPVYLWQCRQDDVVPFENSLLLVSALKREGVRHRFRPVEGSAHGWALGTGTPAEGWLEEAVSFWRNAAI